MTMTRRSAFRFVAGAPAVAAGFGGLVRAQGATNSGEGRKGLRLGARSKLVMVGDSITDAGRARPVGEGRGDAIGKGYVTTLPKVKGMVLITPFYMEPNRSDAMRATMDRDGAAVRRLAQKHRTLFVVSQAPFDEVLKTHYPASLNWDRVHPDYVGSMVLARAFVDAIGFDWTR